MNCFVIMKNNYGHGQERNFDFIYLIIKKYVILSISD